MTAINPLEELLWNPEVTEIMVNAPDDVWVERQGRIEPTDVKFLDEEHVLKTIEQIVSPDGCRRDDRGRQFYACSLLRKGTPFDGCCVSAMRDDGDGHWKLNIRKRCNDDAIGTIFQNIDDRSLENNLLNYYRAVAFARMGIGSDAEIPKVELRPHECC